jgi:hypothetical protein
MGLPEITFFCGHMTRRACRMLPTGCARGFEPSLQGGLDTVRQDITHDEHIAGSGADNRSRRPEYYLRIYKVRLCPTELV